MDKSNAQSNALGQRQRKGNPKQIYRMRSSHANTTSAWLSEIET